MKKIVLLLIGIFSFAICFSQVAKWRVIKQASYKNGNTPNWVKSDILIVNDINKKKTTIYTSTTHVLDWIKITATGNSPGEFADKNSIGCTIKCLDENNQECVLKIDFFQEDKTGYGIKVSVTYPDATIDFIANMIN